MTYGGTEMQELRRRFVLRERLQLPGQPTAANTSIAVTPGMSFTPTSDEVPAAATSGLIQIYGVRIEGGLTTSSASLAGRKIQDAATASHVVEELTTKGVVSRTISKRVDALIELVQDERFEDGVDNDLSVGLRALFRNFGRDLASVLDIYISEGKLRPRILAETLKTLGSIDDQITKDWRLTTLIGFLTSSSANIRDAAAVGLGYLDDSRAIPYLLDAIQREPSETFQEDLRAVVEQLSG